MAQDEVVSSSQQKWSRVQVRLWPPKDCVSAMPHGCCKWYMSRRGGLLNGNPFAYPPGVELAHGRVWVDRHETLHDARLTLERRCVERIRRGYRQERS